MRLCSTLLPLLFGASLLGPGLARADECDGLAARIASAMGGKVGRRTGPSIDLRVPGGLKLDLTCRADSGVKTPADFPGHTLGVWFAGNEYPFLAWMSKLGVKTDGPPGVTVLKQGFNVDPLLQKVSGAEQDRTAIGARHLPP